MPSDDGDDLLTGDVSALHLSDYDVYAQTGGRQIRKSYDMKREDNNNTSNSNAQLKSDEDFARHLYQEEQLGKNCSIYCYIYETDFCLSLY